MEVVLQSNHEPFYDRSWQVEVVGPISSSIGDGEWASLVISNFWHQTQNAGGQISVDGLNYYPIQFPGRGSSQPDIEIDFDFTNASLDFYWDVNKPHKEMRAFAVPSGGLLFPQYFDNGNAAFLDTTLSWNEVAVQFPSEYCQIDMTGTIHCVANAGTTSRIMHLEMVPFHGTITRTISVERLRALKSGSSKRTVSTTSLC